MSKKIRKKSSNSDSSGTARAATVNRIKPTRNVDMTVSEKLKSRLTSPVSQSAEIAEGSPAPPFNLPREDGTDVSLADFAGRKLVIFFYPRSGTPGCTREATDFTRLAKEFAGMNDGDRRVSRLRKGTKIVSKQA